MTTPPAAQIPELTTRAELEAELRSAEQDFAQGNFIELTVQELDRCVGANEWPWPSAASA